MNVMENHDCFEFLIRQPLLQPAKCTKCDHNTYEISEYLRLKRELENQQKETK